MKTSVKKVMRYIAAGLFLLCAGFAAGYMFDRSGNSIHKAGVTANVSGYDETAKRVERATAAIRDVTRNVREAQGEIRLSVNEVGDIGSLASDVRDGNVRALNGALGIESGIQFIMGILDEAERRNAAMEEIGDNGVD